MTNQKGFVLPVSVTLSFIIFAVLLHQINLYNIEKRSLLETEEIYALENMLMRAVKDIEIELKNATTTEDSIQSSIIYPNGSAHYTISNQDDGHSLVDLSCVTVSGRKYRVLLTYDSEHMTLLRWREYR